METHRRQFCERLAKTASLTVSLTDSEGSLVIVKDESLSAEAYRLNIEKNQIKIEAGDIQGVNHGLASLLQLIMTAKMLNYRCSPYRTSLHSVTED